MRRNIFDEIHDDFRATAREFFERECVPNVEKWERDGKVSREAWLAAGEHGLIGWEFDETLRRAWRQGLPVQPDHLRGDVHDRIGRHRPRRSERHPDAVHEPPHHRRAKERWLPKFISGEYIGSMAMSEPAAGSDLAGIKTTARDEGDHWVVNGQKTFISNGLLSKLVLTAVKTDPSAGRRASAC